MRSHPADREPKCPVIDFDFQAATSYEAADEQWRTLRGQHAAAWTDHYDGHWVVSRYEDNAAAFRDWETFSSARTDPKRLAIVISDAEIGVLIPEELDPPLWHPYRRILAELMSPGEAKALHGSVTKWVNHYLDAALAKGTFDLVNDFASPVPGSITLEWIGFPQSDWERMSHAWHNLVGFAPGTPEFEGAIADFVWMDERIKDEVGKRRSNPTGDVMSVMANREINGEEMPLEYAEGLVRLAIAGGVETTTSVVGSALVHLHFHRADRAALIENPDLIDGAIEEFLRVYAPVRTHARTVAADVEFAGCPMRKGDRVLLSYASANRDERAFEDPDRFILDRFPNRHLSFGIGIHRCPGSHLARLEFKEMLSAVLRRIPDYEIIEEELMPYPNWGGEGGWARVPATATRRSR